VQPIVILGLLLFKVGLFDLSSVLLFLVVCIWGIRLTANWVFTFSGLNRQDWRYDMIKGKTGKLFPMASLLGIQLLPTLIVYTCILPAIVFITESDAFNFVTVIGLLVSLTGLTLEAVADKQMHAFKSKNQDRSLIIREGLWRNSRHPNYLGELMMWWGVFIVLLSARADGWYLGVGALLNTVLFLFISIPMAERNMARYKANFATYKKQTRMLLPLPKKP
jgi:steroid 5-alpha reductase family enzyme